MSSIWDTNILWIDDEPTRWAVLRNAIINSIHCTTISMAIPLSGETVRFAHGYDQIEHYLTCGIRWDCILLDGDMPLMSGPDVCEKFLIERNIPVIIVSMNPSKVDLMKFMLEEYAVKVYVAPITNPYKISQILFQIIRETKNGSAYSSK